MADSHVLIIGGGIAGLLLAQALKREGIAFTVFERDPDAYFRGKGWGLTLHWVLDTFLSLLPQHLIDRISETLVDPVAAARGENGRFPFFDLQTGETRWVVPPTKRLRMSREKLRRLLMDGVDVQWSKELTDITESPDGIVAHFGESTYTGSHLVGCDGGRSKTRQLLCTASGYDARSQPLPVRLLGASVACSVSVGQRMQQLDPYFFQGGDPQTNAFHFFSFLDTPANNDREESDTFDCQIIVSWPYRKGFLVRDEATEVPVGNAERVRLMKAISRDWTSPFRDVVQCIPEETQVQSIRLEDWVPEMGAWSNMGGRATLMSDAAHAMTMYRGEAANHGITDVRRWLDAHLEVLKVEGPGEEALAAACSSYEEEMIGRTRVAVLASRQACLDAHDYSRISDTSPLVSRRAIVAVP
ncbi:hypothetical protein LTR95_009873 [Oleoguttula sp. CCFEE 5521]